MSFESRVISFSGRFLSDRAFHLIVEPALADLQFDDAAGRRSRFTNRVAVLRAVAGGLGDDWSRESDSVFKLTLLLDLLLHVSNRARHPGFRELVSSSWSWRCWSWGCRSCR